MPEGKVKTKGDVHGVRADTAETGVVSLDAKCGLHSDGVGVQDPGSPPVPQRRNILLIFCDYNDCRSQVRVEKLDLTTVKVLD